MKILSFRDLIVWKEGHKLVLLIYSLTRTFPKVEMFGLVSQMQRAAVSITSNISEGFTRQTAKEKIRFYYISLGSLCELDNQLIISKDLAYIENAQFAQVTSQIETVHKLLNAFIRSAKVNELNADQIPNTKY